MGLDKNECLFENMVQRVYWITWSMIMCYDVD
jgi:hypothetical protein